MLDEYMNIFYDEMLDEYIAMKKLLIMSYPFYLLVYWILQ